MGGELLGGDNSGGGGILGGGAMIRGFSMCSANAIAGKKETWCQLDNVFSVGLRLIQSLVTAEPKGADGTTAEGFVVLTCACSR